MRTVEDAVWLYFGYPNEFWDNKCAACRKKILEAGLHVSKVPECIDCWKIEVWLHSPWLRAVTVDEEESLSFFLGLAYSLESRIEGFTAKTSRQPVQVVRTGVPVEEYPQRATDRLLMVYASSTQERENARNVISQTLSAPLQSGRIPVRRGCWLYDTYFGPWQSWYDPNKDYEREKPPHKQPL